MEKEKMVYETPIIEVESFDIECLMDGSGVTKAWPTGWGSNDPESESNW